MAGPIVRSYRSLPLETTV